MASLSGYLLNRCYEALAESQLVNPQNDLRNIFAIRELEPYQDRIPYADNARERAEKIVMLLLGQSSEQKEDSPLLTFLRFAITHLPEPGGRRRELSECCALVEIEYVLMSMADGNKYAIRDVAELITHFYTHPYINDNTYVYVLNQLSPEIARKVRKRLRDLQNLNLPPGFDVPAVVSIFIACLSTPDGVGQLAWRLYQLDNGSSAWRELDGLVRNLYQASVTYARLQQLQLLLQPLKLPLDVLPNAYRASAPEASALPIGDEITLLPRMLAKLGELPQPGKFLLPGETPRAEDNILPITEFAAHLAQYARQMRQQNIQKDIESWIKARAQEQGEDVAQYMTTLKKKLQASAPASIAYLLIVVEPQDEQTFEIRAWLLDNQNQPAEKTEPYISPKPVVFTNVPGCMSEIRRKYAAYLSRDLTIEVFLSDKDLLCCAVDHWRVDSGLAHIEFDIKFGIMHKLVVRSLERAQNMLIRNFWQEKWNMFQSFMQAEKFATDGNDPKMKGPCWVCEEQDYKNREALFGVLNRYDIVCLTMGFVPSSPEDTNIRAAILAAGIPIVLWPREKMKSLAGAFNRFKAQLADFFQSPQELLNLPDWVFTQRVEAVEAGDDHHGHHLTLLWDDPNRLPPDISGGQLIYQR